MEDYCVFANKAQECIDVATDCFEKQHYNSCVNRAYYAMLQISVAVLFKAGVEPSGKRIGHEWVHGEFSRVFIRQRKRFPQLKGLLARVQEWRNTADYTAEAITLKKAQRVLDTARVFFEHVMQEVRV